MNDENLTRPSRSEARKRGKSGGVASGISRRNKKAMQEVWETVRKLPVSAGELADIEQIQSIAELKGANITVGQAIILSIAKRAMSGDVRAFEALSRLTEAKSRIDEIEAEMAVLEVVRLRMEVDAFRRIESEYDSGVTIVDDIHN